MDTTTGVPPELHAHLPQGVSVHEHATDRHTSAYLAAGDPDDPVVLLCHGWPELGRSWVRVMEPLAAAGFRVVAPDMRGYGASRVHSSPDDYAIAEAVLDMCELLDHLGVDAESPAFAVGHDYGAPVVWNLATHHPELLAGVAGVCVPHLPPGTTLVDHIDRDLYPAEQYPLGQWDYLVAHVRMPEVLAAEFDGDVRGMIASIMRAGNPRAMERPVPNATVQERGGWFPNGHPYHEPDPRVLDDIEFEALVASLSHTGFTAANSWYQNNRANAAYAENAVTGGRITVPALFVHARYDATCATLTTTAADPMRSACEELHEEIVEAGHWVAQEQPAALTEALLRWLRPLRPVSA
ncbi:alpha/beta hydrolase [Enteractinococcus fodinae]|uniref:Pimeloyl-ACP methyl ester carboxylesterase n=1 Tax=Enteractinococcus fodinae TaxID=684663 RepID=A0ABU2AZI9_9MICC|nr:alpha/beta hydrolase [Enteractinococcus fodinae]MDR7346189.1 pimeloyl-ACP methyl ester carboxylesterase [Enteractinococcus fodinae]